MKINELNEIIGIELIKVRNNTGLSLADVAARSEILGLGRTLDSKAVWRVENQPLVVDFVKVLSYLSAVGMPLEDFHELLNKHAYEDSSHHLVIRPRDEFTKKPSTLLVEMLTKVEAFLVTLPERNQEFLRINAFTQAKSYLTKTKPIVGFIGLSNVGKTTLINVTLGQAVLPTSMLFTTRLITVVMHVSDKPAYIGSSVAVFKKGFRPIMVFDEASVKQYLVTQGDKSILSGHNHSEAYMALVFADADILNHVWLLDTPGDLENRSDTEMAISSAELVDGVVFMSDMRDFLKPNERGLMANVLRLIRPLSSQTPTEHLLLVSSQCDSEADIDVVTKMSSSVIDGMQAQLEALGLPTSEQLASRIQPFGRENNRLRNEMMSKIQELAKYLIPHKEDELVAAIKYEIENHLKSNLTRTLESLEFVKLHGDERANSIKELELKVTRASETVTDNFHSLLNNCVGKKKATIQAMKSYFDDITSQVGLTKIIEAMYPEQKEAQAEIGNYISQLLSVRMEEIFKDNSDGISIDVIKFLDEWADTMGKPKNYSQSLFRAGFYGLSNIGAFEFCPALNKLNAIYDVNMTEPDTTKNTMFSENGITMAAAIGFIAYRYVGGSWQSNLAKKTANVIKDEAIWMKVESMIANFWDGTEQAISSGLRSLNMSAQDDLSHANHSGELNLPNHNEVDLNIATVKQALSFINEIEKLS